MEAQRGAFERRCRNFQNEDAEYPIKKPQRKGQTSVKDVGSTIRHIADDYWQSHGKHLRPGRNCRTPNNAKTPDNPEGARPGQNIEDVERGLLEGLLFGGPARRPPGFDGWVCAMGPQPKHRMVKPDPDASVASGVNPTTASAPEYIIDPITNRKVQTAAPEAYNPPEKAPEPPVQPVKPYRSHYPPVTDDVLKPPEEKSLAGEPFPVVSQDRQPVLESEQYLADLRGTPAAGTLSRLSRKHGDISWHRRVGFVPAFDETVSSANDTKGAVVQKRATSYIDRLEARYRTGFYCHEPDGMYAESYRQSSSKSTERPRYPKYAESQCREPDGKHTTKAAQAVPFLRELDNCRPSLSGQLDGGKGNGLGAEAPAAGLREYPALQSSEPTGKYAEQVDPKPEDDSSDLGAHEAFSYEDSEATANVEPELVAPELDRSRAVLYNEPDGRDKTELATPGYSEAELKAYQPVDGNKPDGEAAERRDANEVFLEFDSMPESSADTKSEKTYYRRMLESIMSESAAESDVADQDATATLRKSKEQIASSVPETAQGLTGHYVRDFPEEFSRSWSTENSASKSTLLPADAASSVAQAAEPCPVAPQTPRPASALEPALERYRSRPENGTSVGNSPGGNDTSMAAAGTPADIGPGPTLYKVLVYDPTMQCINTAETTSTVPDSSSPLTPAEVLLRISNPSKFLPHFGPLQAQGFEIVSGAGDVLIFRRVGEVVSQSGQSDNTVNTTIATTAGTIATSVATSTRPPVNPIDMTGGLRDYTVAAGRFASPTGFVNYDLPPRFNSGIEVHREEPVFSGPKEEPGKRGKTSLPKRLALGALWVAGASYSLGVVGEYFRTGGANGKGPKGF